ncbi:ABC transporter ATP-binding protein [Streptococcus ruminantium]|uniref:ABC transporter ATP-binding protein n=1 Tax=Streptococcus ruminantium TaxID=1917441 RepID=UPI0012DF4D2C|nr:ABC transporter ATP-binding protein [Streptococcus ruminantium]
MTDSIIKIENLSKKFNNNDLFDQLHFECSKGKIIGITGVNGAGKSVLFKLIAGLMKPDSGSIKVYGEDIVGNIPSHLGALIEEPGFIPNYTGFENLEFLAAIQHKIGKEEIIQALNQVGLVEDKDKKVKNYSLGMKKKLGIAQAIMEKPKILLLDEPTNALDRQSVSKIHTLLKELSKEKGVTILLASHNEMDIQCLCDEVYIIEDKKCILLE